MPNLKVIELSPVDARDMGEAFERGDVVSDRLENLVRSAVGAPEFLRDFHGLTPG